MNRCSLPPLLRQSVASFGKLSLLWLSQLLQFDFSLTICLLLCCLALVSIFLPASLSPPPSLSLFLSLSSVSRSVSLPFSLSLSLHLHLSLFSYFKTLPWAKSSGALSEYTVYNVMYFFHSLLCGTMLIAYLFPHAWFPSISGYQSLCYARVCSPLLWHAYLSPPGPHVCFDHFAAGSNQAQLLVCFPQQNTKQ